MIKSFYDSLQKYEKPHAWLSFYFNIRVPLGILGGIIGIISSLYDYLYSLAVVELFSLAIFILFIFLVMAHNNFSYAAMLSLVALESISFFFQAFDNSGNELYLIVGLIYFSLNCMYFSKRKDFFHSTTHQITNETQDLANDTVFENTESEDAESEVNNSQRRFCKLCGGEIDRETKKCTNCGKQYFKLTANHLLKLLVASLIGNILIASLAFYNYTEYSKERSNWIKQEAQLNKQISEYSAKAHYLDLYVVFTTEYGEKFHSYGCQYITGKNTAHWIITDAIKNGYYPCSLCRDEASWWAY